MKLHYTLIVSFTAFFLMLSVGLSGQSTLSEAPDYSKTESWISLPAKNINYSADVFYVYPTIIFGDDPLNMDIQNPDLRREAMGVMKEQATVFAKTADLYAPYYRQVSLPVLSLPPDEYHKYFDTGYQDVKSAFLYYLEHYNNGRPFILAGHSQGSDMLLELMKDIFKNEEIRDKMIAAYLIGYSITNDDLKKYPWLKIAQSDDDTGVIITYNTQSPDATGSPILLPGANCVNPLSWTTTLDHAPKTLNQGAVFFDENQNIIKTELNYTDAQIRADGALIVTILNPDDFWNAETSAFPRGVFHAYDYNFFFRNLEANAKLRVKRFFEINKN